MIYHQINKRRIKLSVWLLIVHADFSGNFIFQNKTLILRGLLQQALSVWLPQELMMLRDLQNQPSSFQDCHQVLMCKASSDLLPQGLAIRNDGTTEVQNSMASEVLLQISKKCNEY